MSSDVWTAYVKQFGTTPKDATQLLQFSKRADNSYKALTFKESRDMFNAHKTKPVVTNGIKIKPKKKALPPTKSGGLPASPSNQGSKSNKLKGNNAFAAAKPINVNKQFQPQNISVSGDRDLDKLEQTIKLTQNELNKLKGIEQEFSSGYNAISQDYNQKFENIISALKARQNDVNNWRKKEFDEGLNGIKTNIDLLRSRLNELSKLYENDKNNLKNSTNQKTLNNTPKFMEMYLMKFRGKELEIGGTLNQIFGLGYPYNYNQFRQLVTVRTALPQNMTPNRGNRQASPQDKRALNLANSPFGKGFNPAAHNNNTNNNRKKAQARAITHDSTQKGIKSFDIGNNAKYARAQQTVNKSTNKLPDNFWDSGSDSDSDDDTTTQQKLSPDEIAAKWKQQNSNIITSSPKKSRGGPKPKQKAVSMYDHVSSSEDEDEHDEDDGFQKYKPPSPKNRTLPSNEFDNSAPNNTIWIVKERGLTFKYDTMWFKVPKMRNNKANGSQMKSFLVASGLSNDLLKKIWKLSDLDKDGKMGNEEFSLCMFLMDEVKSGKKLPIRLPKNYIPPGFRGIKLPKTPPKRTKALPKKKNMPPKMNLNPQTKPKPNINSKQNKNNIKVLPKKKPNDASKKPKKVEKKIEQKVSDKVIKVVKNDDEKENNDDGGGDEIKEFLDKNGFNAHFDVLKKNGFDLNGIKTMTDDKIKEYVTEIARKCEWKTMLKIKLTRKCIVYKNDSNPNKETDEKEKPKETEKAKDKLVDKVE